MLDLTRLAVDRQINAGNALSAILAVVRQTPLVTSTVTRGEAVIAATLALVAARDTAPKAVDNATDSVTVAFKDGLAARERSLRDSVVPLNAAQQQTLGHLRLVLTRLFPAGTDYIRLPMEMQNRHLTELRSRMSEPEVSSAIDALGLRSEADHMVAHIDLYGRVLGQDAGAAGRATELASATWHEAFRLFAAQVTLDYNAQPEIRQELLGRYEAQLEPQRALKAKARKARTEVEEAPPPSQGEAPPA